MQVGSIRKTGSLHNRVRPADMWTANPNAGGTAAASSYGLSSDAASAWKNACRNPDRRCDLPTPISVTGSLLRYHLLDGSKRVENLLDQPR